MCNRKLVKALSVILILQLGTPAQSVSQPGRQKARIDQVTVMEQSLSKIEQSIFHKQYNQDIITDRVLRLEKRIFGRIQSGSLQHRIDELIVHESDNQQSIPLQINQQTIEQSSWDTSALIDQLLNAQETANSEELDKAMSQLNDMPHPDSDTSPEKLRTAAMYHQRGAKAFRERKFRDALINFKQAQILNPWDSTILNDLVRTEISTSDLQAAVLYGPIAIMIAPASTIAWCNMAEIFARAKQYSQARGCAYLACLMSDDPNKTLSIIQNTISSIDEPDIRNPFKQALLMARYTMKDYNDSQSGNTEEDKAIGIEADAALYKANILLLFVIALQQIKHNSGIVLAVTISQSGQIVKNEILRSSGDSALDNTAIEAIADVKLPPLPKSITSDRRQFIVPVDKIVLALADAKHG